MLVPDEALELIDSVSENRTAFMVEASVAAAKRRRREIVDAEVARICTENFDRDRAIAAEFDGTLLDGLDDE
jgi:hypothetical protein